MILDRYILKLWLSSFLGFFLVITGVLLFGRTIRAVQAFGNNPIDWGLLAEMLFAIMPYFLTLTIPFAFFFALIKALSYLQENSETDALLAAGVSPFRLLRPMFILALLIWVFLSWTVMQWMPAGQKIFIELYHAVKQTAAMPSFTPQQFTMFEGLTIYHAGEDNDGNMTQFMLEDKQGDVDSIYLAKKAKIERKDQFMILSMFDGVHLEGEGNALRSTYFSTYSLSTDIGDTGVIKHLVVGNEKPSLMNIQELNAVLESAPTLIARAEWHRRWILSSSILILVVFAFPLASSAKRSGKNHGWMWGIVLLLLIYNVQLALHKQVVSGKFEWWMMWLGQLFFFFTGLLMFLQSSKVWLLFRSSPRQVKGRTST